MKKSSSGNVSLGETLCILGVSQIRAVPEPERYNLLCSFSLKNFSYFNLRKKHCNETSRFKIKLICVRNYFLNGLTIQFLI